MYLYSLFRIHDRIPFHLLCLSRLSKLSGLMLLLPLLASLCLSVCTQQRHLSDTIFTPEDQCSSPGSSLVSCVRILSQDHGKPGISQSPATTDHPPAADCYHFCHDFILFLISFVLLLFHYEGRALLPFSRGLRFISAYDRRIKVGDLSVVVSQDAFKVKM